MGLMPPKEHVVEESSSSNGGPGLTDGDAPGGVHASESFFILEERLVTESAGGRRAAAADEPPRARASANERPFRFRRVVPKGEQPSEAVQIAGAIGLLVFYVMTMLGFSTIYQGTVKLALWRHGVESVEIDGLPVLDHVKAEGGPSSAVGEGLADALNVGGL